MMFLDIVTQCVLQLDAMRSVRERTHVISAADRLLDSLLGCYREYGGGDSPTIAITDWEGQKTRFEHQRLAEHFAARGCPTVVCDPRALRRVDGHLELEDGRKIDLIYRRALATEMISRRSEIEPLLGAYRDGKVCMVNPLRSYVASAKSLLIRLQDRDLPMALKAASHVVPRTLLLTDPDVRKAVMSAPKRYVLKKSESHGGKHVVLPGVSSDGAWREAIEASRRDIWIAQDYVDVPTMQLPVANGERVEWIERYFNWNPFVFGGRYAGGLVRTSTTPLINITQGGGLLPTLGT
jgi:uncharacterized circularly permuted ATP-grasp superfamily protein